MDSSFEQRGKALENKFVHDQELKFRIRARKYKLLGIWAAEKIHSDHDHALKYAMEIVRFSVDEHSEKTIIDKVLADMKSKGVNVNETEIKKNLKEFQEIAEKQIIDEKNTSDF